jgi:hypothetical protein
LQMIHAGLKRDVCDCRMLVVHLQRQAEVRKVNMF